MRYSPVKKLVKIEKGKPPIPPQKGKRVKQSKPPKAYHLRGR